MELRKNLSHAPSIVLGALAVGVAMWASIQPAKLPAHTLPPAGWGRTNPDISQANIGQNICNPAWHTSSNNGVLYRPSSEFTTALKIKQLKELGYPIASSTKEFEEDHLISLELGGAPSDPMNLWPQPYTNVVDGQNLGAREKDKVENYLHDRVCSKTETLSSAQHRISTNWVEVYSEMKGVKYTGSESDTDD